MGGNRINHLPIIIYVDEWEDRFDDVWWGKPLNSLVDGLKESHTFIKKSKILDIINNRINDINNTIKKLKEFDYPNKEMILKLEGWRNGYVVLLDDITDIK